MSVSLWTPSAKWQLHSYCSLTRLENPSKLYPILLAYLSLQHCLEFVFPFQEKFDRNWDVGDAVNVSVLRITVWQTDGWTVRHQTSHSSISPWHKDYRLTGNTWNRFLLRSSNIQSFYSMYFCKTISKPKFKQTRSLASILEACTQTDTDSWIRDLSFCYRPVTGMQTCCLITANHFF